jgi:regulator of cell morphogenesis and NO signaling
VKWYRRYHICRHDHKSAATAGRGEASIDNLPKSGRAHQTLAELAVALPGATTVFRRHKLDFCCGGTVTLQQAAAERKLDLALLDEELEGLAAGAGEALDTQPSAALIALIESRFHAGHRRELPELARLARRVEAVHAGKPLAPRGLAAALERMLGDLEAHMQKEEQVLFPLMLRGGHPMLRQPISVMVTEHAGHGEALRAMEALAHDYALPEEACTTWRALYAGMQHLTAEVMEHIALENNVLFPRFAA